MEQPWVRVGAYAVVIDATDRMLLVRARGSGDDPERWWLPGGGLEFGEDPEAAVLRELAEETGLSGEILGIAGTFSTVYDTTLERPGDPVHVIGIVYRIRVADGRLRAEQAGSTDHCEWVDRDAASRLPLSPGGRLGVRLAWPPGT